MHIIIGDIWQYRKRILEEINFEVNFGRIQISSRVGDGVQADEDKSLWMEKKL